MPSCTQEFGQFPLLITPEAGESLFGFALRLCDRNALDRGSELLDFIGGRSLLAPFASDVVERLSTVSGVSAKKLRRMQPEPVARDRCRLLGHPVAMTSIEWSHFRFCPRCLAQKPVYRLIWDYAPMTACAVHGTPLIASCPVCRLKLRKGKGAQRWMHCPQLHNLADAEAPRSKRSFASIYLEWRFGAPAPLPAILQSMPASVSKASPDTAVRLARFLGEIARAAEAIAGGDQEGWPDEAALEQGFVSLVKWPSLLRPHLELLHRSSPGALFPVEFRTWLKATWRRLAGVTCSEPIRQELDRFCISKGFLFGPAEVSLVGTAGDDRVAVHLAARASGIGIVRFLEVVRVGEWTGWQGACSGQPFCVLRSELKSWLTRSDLRLGMADVGRHLGCRASDIFAMARGGCFGWRAAQRFSAREEAAAFLLPAEVARLHDRLCRAVRRGRRNSGTGNPTSLAKACFRNRFSLAELVGAVLDGTVPAVDWRQPLLGGLLVTLVEGTGCCPKRHREEASLGLRTPDKKFDKFKLRY